MEHTRRIEVSFKPVSDYSSMKTASIIKQIKNAPKIEQEQKE